ncbi:MAG: DUF4125 family protein [Desulfobacterales bacterium]|nr:DUF4125 family protein [Desulfobacterales bacterium]
MEEKSKIIDKIIRAEWQMFISVNQGTEADPVKNEHPTCRDFPDKFRAHRESKLFAWSCHTLKSYLNDIETAREKGENLMTYKYARMDKLIPCENQIPFIDAIASTLLKWQKEFIDRYPGIMSGARALSGGQPGIDWPSFENYLRCELESYSERTLESLSNDVNALKEKGKNMSDEIYTYLVKKKGYQSLEEAETKKSRIR